MLHLKPNWQGGKSREEVGAPKGKQHCRGGRGGSCEGSLLGKWVSLNQNDSSPLPPPQLPSRAGPTCFPGGCLPEPGVRLGHQVLGQKFYRDFSPFSLSRQVSTLMHTHNGLCSLDHLADVYLAGKPPPPPTADPQ